jgi:flagellar export protein FliJ
MSARRFKFALEPLRTVREHAEQVAMRDLAGELRQADAIQHELHSTERRLTAARQTTPEEPLSAVELAARQLYLERVEREVADAKLRAQVQDGHVETMRERLQHAAREREQVDRLAERRRAEHERVERRRERDAGDEISIQMHLTDSAVRAWASSR